MKWTWLRLIRRLEPGDPQRFAPDVIISTQMIPAAMASYLKQRGKVRRRWSACMTDFGVHDFWKQRGVDRYCVAHESILGSDRSRDVSARAEVATGVPLMPDFAHPLSQARGASGTGAAAGRAGRAGAGRRTGTERRRRGERVARAAVGPRTSSSMPGKNDNARARSNALAAPASAAPARLRLDRSHGHLSARGGCGRRQARRNHRRRGARLRPAAARDALARRSGRLQCRFSRAPRRRWSGRGWRVARSRRLRCSAIATACSRCSGARGCSVGATARARVARTRARSRASSDRRWRRNRDETAASIARSALGLVDAWYYRRHQAAHARARCCSSGVRAIAGRSCTSRTARCCATTTPIGRLHFNNASIAALGEGSMHRVGFRFAKLMRESLRKLAEVGAHRIPRCATCASFRA